MRNNIKYGLRAWPLPLTVFAMVFLFQSCEKLVFVQELTNTDCVKIYLNQYSANIYAIDIKRSEEDGYFLFGLAGSYMESKFDATGDLYLTRVDEEGHQEWEEFYSIGSRKNSYPSNILKTDDNQYLMVWNDGPGHHYAVSLKPEHDPRQIQIKTLEMPEQVHHLLFISQKIDPADGYIMLAIGSREISDTTYRQLSILSADTEFTGLEVLSVYEYDPAPISGYIDNDLAFIEFIHHWLFLGHDGKRYFFNGPVGDRMALMYVGDNQYIYSHEEYLISNLINLSDGTLDGLLQNPYSSGDEMYRVKELELSPVNQTFSDLSTIPFPPELQSLDPGANSFLLDSSLVGTLLSQQIIIYNGKESEILGSTYPYEAAGICMDGNGNLMIVGTTRMHYLQQRMFMIKYRL